MSLKCTIFEIFTFEKYCDLGLGVTQGHCITVIIMNN